jgi:hypothetical protein
MITRHYFYIAEGGGYQVNGVISVNSLLPAPAVALERVRHDAGAAIANVLGCDAGSPQVLVKLVAFNRV